MARGWLGVALAAVLSCAGAATAAPTGAATAAPTGAAETGEGRGAAQCLLEVSGTEEDYVAQINARRARKGRPAVAFDQVLHTAGSVYVEVMASEGEGSLRKLRLQTRNQLLEEFVAVGALTMKGKSLDAIWKRMTRNTYPRSIIMREHYRHVGIGITQGAEGKWYVAVFFGGETVTPLAC